eukprot:CAMPEP_0180218874 /NCGR_PEP_ID=MMETSP0987-20121128/18022_1 /TAXON_ID=697907 /ORGANISM="non described non described, Strain CCMP2293" /LENGTH=57 /DNA_ID=CAMNT_0022179149 /DNA_START=95 /DNA_END=268 /DNA_ORIENTATION=+
MPCFEALWANLRNQILEDLAGGNKHCPQGNGSGVLALPTLNPYNLDRACKPKRTNRQ